jgi:hypothetical protein
MAIFTGLTAFANKEYKFKQAKSKGLADSVHGDDAAHGVCFGLVMMWVREKLTTTGSWYRVQHKNFSPGHGGDVHDRNAITMLQAAEYQLHGRKQGDDKVATYLGLRPVEPDIQLVVRPDRNYNPEVQIFETLVRVAKALRSGQAVVIELDVHGASRRGGHAIGMYRSRGQNLYFFDPNVGVYQLRNVAGFMQAWLEGYRNGRGWTFSAFRSGTDWIHHYAR